MNDTCGHCAKTPVWRETLHWNVHTKTILTSVASNWTVAREHIAHFEYICRFWLVLFMIIPNNGVLKNGIQIPMQILKRE